MRICTEIHPVTGRIEMNLNGRWVTEPVLERLKKLELRDSFTHTSEWTFGVDKNGYPNVRVQWLKESEGANVKDVEHQITFIRDHLVSYIGRGFTDIAVDPTVNPLNNNKGSVDTIMLIAEETGCSVDYGSWLTPIRFLPESNVEYNEVMDLLNTFEMKYV